MRYYKLFLILLFISCKSTESTTNNKLDVDRKTIDKTVTVQKLDRVSFSFDEITVVAHDPKLETTITDSNGITKTFKNVKTITIKKQKKDSIVQSNEVKNDIDEHLKDKSIIRTKDKSISDANNYKWIFIAIAFIVLFMLIGYLVFKFKR